MNVLTPNKFIFASSALIITLTTMTDYFVSRKTNWKSRFIFRSFIIPPMMWAVNQLAQSKRELYLMVMGGLFASITSSLENIPIYFNISLINSYAPSYSNDLGFTQGNQMMRTFDPVVPVIPEGSQPMTQDPEQFAISSNQQHSWTVGN